MPDNFKSHAVSLTAPAAGGTGVAPNDNTDLPQVARAVYVGGPGNVSGVLADGDQVTFSNLQAGMVYPFRLRRIRASGTTATGLVALW